MNTDYIYYNGKAIILDSNGSEKEIDYYDKLEEVLERENLIEVLENKSISLTNEISQINKDYKKSNKEYIDAVLWFLFPLIIHILSLIFTHFFGNSYINTSLGTVNFNLLEVIVTALLTTPISIILTTSNYKYRQNLQRKRNKKENDIKNIEKQIILQKRKLENLSKEKTNSIEDSYFIARLSKTPDYHSIKNKDLESLIPSLNQDLIIADEEVIEDEYVLKKTLKN